LCRLFAWHSTKPLSVTSVLGPDLQAFTELSTLHRDGWGIAYGDADEIKLVRDTSPAHESKIYSDMLTQMQATNAIAHLRWATEELAVCIPNTHPFVKKSEMGEIAFIHNGGVTRGDSLTALIDADFLNQLEGESDSEQYFAALLTQLRKSGGDILAAYQALVIDFAPIHYTSLNAMILTETELVIVCQHKPENRSPELQPAYYDLFWQSSDGVTSAWSTGVRSNPNNVNEMKNGSLLRINRTTGDVATYEIG
jgi:predicted glutamine amidotransferase